MLRVISLGAGVQSSAMFLMACKGILTPKPDAAIFADTQWESKEVYHWLDELERIGNEHSIPIIRATAGNLRADALTFMRGGGPNGKHRQGVNGRWASMPLYVLNPDGSKGMIRRQCTKEYKIKVIEKEIRKMLGLKPGQRASDLMKRGPIEQIEYGDLETVISKSSGPLVEQWIGISADEAGRMRESRRVWAKLHYPLIFDFDQPMTRGDCKIWLTSNGYPIPQKSACKGCPFHADAEWRLIKADAEDWADVCDFDEAIRECGGIRGKVFLHRSCKPLSGVDFSTAEERGQMNWINECEGMCGV